MKKLVICLITLCMVLSITGCGADPEERRDSGNISKPVESGEETTPVAKEEKTTPTPTVISTPTPTMTPTPTPTPVPLQNTAEQPAALKQNEVAHATGVEETWTDPVTGKVCVVLEDSGEDGITMTRNCFDETGNLVWWESFEYDEKGRVKAIHRKNPECEAIAREELIYLGSQHERSDFYEKATWESEGLYKVSAEYYYVDGTVQRRIIYFPYVECRQYVPEHIYEYDYNGKETCHTINDKTGATIEKRIDGKRYFTIPDTVMEIFELLNDASDEDFEELWDACMERIAEKNLTDDWESLCETFSALTDEYNGSALYKLREEYGLVLYKNKGDGSLYRDVEIYAMYKLLPYVKKDNIKKQLSKKIYQSNCFLDLGGTIWLPSEYKAVKKNMKQAKRPEDGLIRVLVLDNSKTIWNDTINQELLLSDSKYANRMIERAQDMVGGLFDDVADKVILTSYPELADVVLEITTEYPFAGDYRYSNGTVAKVWNISITLKATNQRGKGEVTAKFERKAGQSLTTSGGTKIYMNEPDLKKDENIDEARRFTNTVLSWFR